LGCVGCGLWGVGCGVCGVGCGVWGVGCGVWGVGFGHQELHSLDTKRLHGGAFGENVPEEGIRVNTTHKATWNTLEAKSDPSLQFVWKRPGPSPDIQARLAS
jgi:hypothetical protein